MNLTPIDFGRYIAIKYINKKTKIIESIKDKVTFISKINNSKTDKDFLNNSISKLRSFIPINTLCDDVYFHLILYCFWWTANNKDGIASYYDGISEVFTVLNKYLPEKDQQTLDRTLLTNNKFENTIFNITMKPFNIYNQEQSNSFCNRQTYPDCGETTLRNLINLICFNGKKFDINVLKKYNPIDELIQYYEVFNNFESQSNKTKLVNIYGQQLNARDAWSFLIVQYASAGVKFINACKNGPNINFELNAGLALDEKTGNFFQLIKNLLRINKWADINNDFITNITDSTNNGIGNIYIQHTKYDEITIYCKPNHYYMVLPDIKTDELDINDLNEEQVEIIYLLLNNKEQIYKILKKDKLKYLWVNFDSNMLVDYINSEETPVDIKIKLLELSSTKKYDSDTRRRIVINADNKDLFKSFIKLSNEHPDININEYTYSSKNFNFVTDICDKLKHLNYKSNGIITSVDLSPLINITSIGDNFLLGCLNLTSIDLSPLSNVTLIGNNFMRTCFNLTNIDLTPLVKLTSIGNDFMTGCSKLTTLYLPLNLTSIGNNFMSDCTSLTTINLTHLVNLKSISNNFMAGCKKLTNIYLPPNIISIGDWFMNNCEILTTIDLSPLLNLKTIDHHFMSGCTELTTIYLPPNIISIGDLFMSFCQNLTTIDLSPLINLNSIGNNFMARCDNLKEIKFNKDKISNFNFKSIIKSKIVLI
jgi:hypothetical protein